MYATRTYFLEYWLINIEKNCIVLNAIFVYIKHKINHITVRDSYVTQHCMLTKSWSSFLVCMITSNNKYHGRIPHRRYTVYFNSTNNLMLITRSFSTVYHIFIKLQIKTHIQNLICKQIWTKILCKGIILHFTYYINLGMKVFL